MIEVIVYKNTHSCIERMTISGHSGYSVKGNDPVCAAVSTLVSTLVIGVKDVCDDTCTVTENKNKNSIEVNFSPTYKADTAAVITTIYRSLCEIERRYSDWILVKEVNHG